MARRRNPIAQQPAKPPADAQLAQQATGTTAGQAMPFVGHGFPNLLNWASGGTWDNPLAFEGYGRQFLGTHETWRIMLRHPVIWATRAAVTDPVRTSSWNYEPTYEGIAPTILKKMIDGIRRDFDPLRRDFIDIAIRGRDACRAGGELVWDIDGPGYRLRRIVAQPWFASVYQTDTGDFAGLGVALRSGLSTLNLSLSVDGSMQPALPAPYKSWLYCHTPSPEFPLLGTSWLEAARDAWRDWLDAAQQLQKLVAKISGMLMVVRCPTGNIPGEASTYQVAIEGQLQVVGERGAYALILPGVPIPMGQNGKVVDYGEVAKLGTYQPIQFESIDFGTNSPAIASVLARMQHDEDLMVMAAGRSARTLTEGAAGTHAETASKLDSATVASELLNDDIAHQVQPAVDAWLVLNFGEQYRGAVRITCPPLDTTKQQQRYQLLTLIYQCNNPQLQEASLRVMGAKGIRTVFEDCGMPVEKDFDVNALVPPPSPPPADPTDPTLDVDSVGPPSPRQMAAVGVE